MHRKVRVGPSPIGLGVFTDVPLAPSEVVFFLNGRYLTREENDALPMQGENSIQIGERLYVDPLPPARYLNHSCDPNIGVTPELEVVTLREIAAGEELRFDYSTTILERAWTMRCACGSPRCRITVGDFDEIPSRLQTRYFEAGIVQEFIAEAVFGIPAARDRHVAA